MNHEQYDRQDRAGVYETLTWLVAATFCLIFWGAIIGLVLRWLNPGT